MLGSTLGHYRIEAPLGAGGMGAVFRARDLHLQREVAIKVLPEGALADAEARKRFRREALALSKLSHPHVATVFDFDTQDGVDFIAMELVPGEPLQERLRRGPLAEATVMALGAQIAEGLAAAHAQGVVHRDLKPSNIVVSPDGRVKIIDFGLARELRAGQDADHTKSMTAANVVMGTLSYMAPEQLLGQQVDARADLYALGVVLFEMATGRSPYQESVPTALVHEILSGTPAPARAIAPHVSERLEALLQICMAKAPEARRLTAAALAEDLRDTSRPVRAPEPAKSATPPATRVRLLSAGVLGLAALVVAVVLLRPMDCRQPVLNALAVLPMENLSNDPQEDYFADGMTDELITRLTQIAALKVIARSSVMSYKHTKKSLAQIAHELGVGAVVTGAVRKAGERARISAQLVRAQNSQSLWADTFEGDLRDVFSLQGQVARSIADRVHVALSPGERAGLATRREVDPRVTDAVLRARYYKTGFGADWLKALDFFNQAIRLDPTYAPAYAGKAETYSLLSNVVLPSRDVMPKARAAAQEALQLDSTDVVARDVLNYVTGFYDWDWATAAAAMKRAAELHPNQGVARREYGQLLVMFGKFDEASTELAQARAIDPLSDYLATLSLWPLFEGRRYRQTIARAEEILHENPNQPYVHMILGQAALMDGQNQRAYDEIATTWRSDTTVTFVRAWMGLATAAVGRRDEARVILREIETEIPGQNFFAYPAVVLCAGLGERDRAFAWLDRAIEERSEELQFLRVDPALDPLRSDPRFAVAVHKVGLDVKIP